MDTRIRFVVDGHQRSGLGHLVRSQCLRAELEERGITDGLEGFDVLVIDSYDMGRLELERMAEQTTVIVLDDYQPERIPPNVALVVNGTFGGGALAHLYPRGPRLALGPEYAIIRREFRVARWVGGGGHVDLRSVCGHSAAVMAELMASADCVTCEAGMRSLEASCVGVPFRDLIIAADNQQHNAGVRPGAVDGFGAYRVADEIERLLS